MARARKPASAKNIAQCKTIDEPGSYLLTKNLTATGNCLVVAADHVTIDLGGYALSGNGTGFGVISSSNDANVAVRNGTVTGFEVGVGLQGPASVVEDVRAPANSLHGIILAPRSIVRGSIAIGNGHHGIVLFCPSGAVGNVATDNPDGNLETLGAGCVLSQNLAP